MSKKNKGYQAEELVSKYLYSNGYKIVYLNYYSQWGEVDIIAEKNNITHFVEVKSREVQNENLAEYAFSYRKQKALWRCVNNYLIQTDIDCWEIDLAVVYSQPRKLIYYYNIILDINID